MTIKTDKELLAEIQASRTWMEDAINQVFDRDLPGALIYGKGGGSKTYTAEQIAKERGVLLHRHKGNLSDAGMYTALSRHPHDFHLFEDVWWAFRNQKLLTHLLSYTWGQRDSTGMMRRSVTRTVHDLETTVDVDGGIIFTLNSIPNMKSPEMQALFSRMDKIHWSPSDDHLAAMMRQAASKGFTHRTAERVEVLTADKCLEVVNEIVLQTATKMPKATLDMRIMPKVWVYRLAHEADRVKNHWTDKISQLLSETELPDNTANLGAREARLIEQRGFVRQIRHLDRADRLVVWHDWNEERGYNGASEMGFNRRLHEVEAEDAANHNPLDPA